MLLTLVDRGVQLTAELQERLAFLEMGRTRNVRLFAVQPSGGFAYDSSSADWGTEEFSAFFRKLAMKQAAMGYSLALDRWTRNLPLRGDQKVSQDELYEELGRMVLDFDGEVSGSVVDAYAVDLDNVRYDGAMLFAFNSERSRCLSVLFSCEKYGCNLSVTIITLFTPEEGLASAELERYALAARGNPYMESFRESILQAVDDVIRVERSIYGDDEPAPGRRSVFE